MKKMNFKHNYKKLAMEVFPTIRSVNYMKKHGLAISGITNVNVYEEQVIEEEKTIPDPVSGEKTLPPITISKFVKSFKATLIGYLDIKIIDIPLEFLRYDAAPLPVKSHEDFVDVLNSFIIDKTGSVVGCSSVETVKRIHWFQHVGCTAQRQIDMSEYLEAI
jgi:hypothetical protein